MQWLQICRRRLIATDGILTVLLLAGLLMVAAVSWAAAAPSTQLAEKGEALFQQKCNSCHTIGKGNLVGPDLKGVGTKRERAWLESFIFAPDKMIAQKDPIATQRLKEFNNIPMPNLGLSKAEVDALITYLEGPTEPEHHGDSPAQPLSAQAKSPAPGDPVIGRELFIGAVLLQNGGPSCMSCHSVAGTGVLGGGTMGPDLTHVFQRFGESGLSSALQGLPFPTMQGVFQAKPLTPAEQGNLLAFFAQSAKQTAEPTGSNFVWIGLGGFIVLVGVPQVLWGKRLKGVRKRLVGGEK